MTGPLHARLSSFLMLAALLLLAGCQFERTESAAQPAKAQPLPARTVAQHADGPVFESRRAQVQLLELFTSEGCSSCPPAEDWLGDLAADDGLWGEVVPVAFHVDYWDSLGWKDPFSDAAYSRRQRRYAAVWPGSGQVYTPGFVLNGEEWRGWFGGRDLPSPSAEETGVLRVALNDGDAEARFTSPLDLPETLTLNLAVLGSGIAVDVEAGENRGRELAHDFVVLGHTESALRQADGAHAATVALPAVQEDAERYALAAWVARPGEPAPLQATGGWLAASHVKSRLEAGR